jgi:hypothetical protein
VDILRNAQKWLKPRVLLCNRSSAVVTALTEGRTEAAPKWLKLFYLFKVAVAAKPATINPGLPSHVCEQLHTITYQRGNSINQYYNLKNIKVCKK